MSEVGVRHATALWLRGGFPRAFLAGDDAASLGWRRNLIQSFLERDIPQLSIRIPARSLRRFWVMLAHLQGQAWNAADRESYFYKTYAGAELDLLVVRGGKRYGFEFKYADAPGTSKSMHGVMADLKLDRLWVVYPGAGRYPLNDRMEALPLAKCAAALKEENLLAD
ncbi:MAG: hypothetical protein Q7U75_17310 [Desulfobacterales bacterium]|nr:hypothetical protein [Desulfobacterales bacterium]